MVDSGNEQRGGGSARGEDPVRAREGVRRCGRRLASCVGPGTGEYVALILLVALIMAGVAAAMKGLKTDEGKELGDIILSKLKQADRRVQF